MDQDNRPQSKTFQQRLDEVSNQNKAAEGIDHFREIMREIREEMNNENLKEAAPEEYSVKSPRPVRGIPMEERPEPMGLYGATAEEAPARSNNGFRNISIRALNAGYIVDVGCHSFAIETKESLIDKLTQYINNPRATERKWDRGELFNK